VGLEFTYKDVFRAVRFGASPKQVWLAFRGILYAFFFYVIFSYAGFLVSGWTFKNIWQTYRFIPCPFYNAQLTWYGWLLWGIGALIVTFFYFVTLTAISKVTYERLRGDEFYEAKEAWKFALKNWKGTFLSPIYLIIFIAILILVGLVFGLVGRIPHVGQILIGLMSLPIFGGAFFVVYLSIVLFVVSVIGPAIVATTESDTFDTLFEGFSVLYDQTWRFFLWEFILGLCTLLAMFVFALLMKYSLSLTKWAIGVWAGPRGWWDVMWNNGRWYLYLPFAPTFLLRWFPSLVAPGKFLALGALKTYPGVTTQFGAFLLGMSFYALAFLIVGYGVSVFAAGQTIIYTILVKLKDEKNLLEMKEETFEAEEIEITPPEAKVEEEKPKKKRGRPKGSTAKKKTTTKKKTTATKKTAKKTTKMTTKKKK